MIELIAGIVEIVIAICSVIIEAIAGLFMAGGEALGAGEALAVLGVLIIEFIVWGVLWLYELAKSLLKWCKPKHVSKPVFWRPKKKLKEDDLEASKNKP